MIRTLVMIAVAGFLLSVVCLSVAVGMAGPEFITRGAWSWSGPFTHAHWGDHHHGFGLTFDDADDDGPQASREIAWTGGETLEVDVPADVKFVQADGPAKLVVRGARGTIDHVVVKDGRVAFDRSMDDASDLTIELTAPKVTRFTLSGSGRLDVQDYRQDSLALRISGDGGVTAHGSAKSVTLDISGSGDADLSGLATDGADVKISGSGQAKVGPKAWAKLDISGSGDVTLLSHPSRLESHVTGSGTIDQEDEATTEPQPAKPGKPV